MKRQVDERVFWSVRYPEDLRNALTLTAYQCNRLLKPTAGLSPTAAARQLGLGWSTVYREVNRAGVQPSL